MSREIDNTGKIIVCDKIIETSQRTNETDISSVFSTLNGTIGFSVGQKQFSKDFSMSLSGNPYVSDSVPASLRVDIYRNGTRLDISNPIVKGSSLLWESMDGKFMKFGEYTETFMQEIGVGNLEKNKEKFKITWATKDADSVPLTATIDVSIGEKVQYALSKYVDPSKVAEDAIVWFDTMEGALGVSHPYNCYLWTRTSSYYDFTNKCYVDWKYFKGDLYYEGQSVDDTVDDMAGKLNKYIEFTSSTDRFTVDKRSNGSDNIRMGVNINGYSNVSFKWSADIQLFPDGQENNQEIAFVVSHDNDYQSITVEVEVSYVEGEETKVVTHQFNLFPIDITKPEMYLGVLDSIPDGDYIPSLQKKVMTGDWFLLSSTNELYTWNGSAWVCINGDSMTGTTFKDLEKVSVALVDMIKIGTNNKTTATILGVFKMLCADNGFIKFLKTWALFCGSGSETSGFYCRIADHDPTTGQSLANPVFIVKYNGNTVFQIDPSSGNVFFGQPNSGLNAPLSGFMYKASDGSIVSKDNNVVINSSGIITAKGCYFENADISGTLSGVSGKFIGSFDTPSLSSLPNTTGGQVYTKHIPSRSSSSDKSQYAAISGLFEKFTQPNYECSLSVNSNVKSVSRTKYTSYTYQFIFKDKNGNQVYFSRAYQRSSTSTPSFEGDLPETDISITVGAGDILIFKDIQIGKDGLQSGQIYRNSSNQLFIVP